MKKQFGQVCLAVACLSITGCAELTHLTRDRTLNPALGSAKVEFIDAKQRAVIAAQSPDTTTTYTYTTPPSTTPGSAGSPQRPATVTTVVEAKGGLRVCAEPSPDALSAIAASGSLGLTAKDKLSLNQSGSLAESAASIGLRTQSIQLMRDAMYRVCEGYLSGALSEGSFETLNRRFQSSMVAILAIEQLTGAVKARQVVLGGSAGVGSAEALLKATGQSTEAYAALKVATADLDTAKAKAKTLADAKTKADTELANTDPATEALQKAATDAAAAATAQDAVVKEQEKKVSDSQALYTKAEQVRAVAATTPASASGSGTFDTANSGTLDADSIAAVSSSVEAIVESTMGLQFSNELCTTVLTGAAYGRLKDTNAAVLVKCADLLGETATRLHAETRVIAAKATYLEAHPNLKPQEFAAISGSETPPADAVPLQPASPLKKQPKNKKAGGQVMIQ